MLRPARCIAAASLLVLGTASPKAQEVALIPQPQQISINTGHWEMNSHTTMTIATPQLGTAAQYLASAVKTQTGIDLKLARKGGAIKLGLNPSLQAGAYQLDINHGGVNIVGADYAGVINAIATLRQLLPIGLTEYASLPCLSVKDSPRFGWRGLMVDCSRHFYTVDEIKQLLDVMAYYKLNHFHWHLTDDQGWRIQIKRYPLLTERGGWRPLNNQDSACLRNAEREDMPNLQLPASKMRRAADGSQEYGGFYTQSQIRDVVRYAAQRAINVVPEIDMPGHSLAAIQNYKGLSCTDSVGWGRLFTTPMCPGKDAMLEFCRNVWSEVFSLFPYEYVHIGGDEVDMKNWRSCPDCQQRMAAQGLTEVAQLQTWFNHYMEDFFRAHGKKMIAWDDVIDGGLSPYTTVMWWRSWIPTGPKRATSHGNELINVPVSYFYLSRREDAMLMPGIYHFDPYASLTKSESQLVRGMHCCLWGERVASVERMWYQLFPRLTAVAEKAWSQPERMNYADFEHRLLAHLPRLEAMGVKYRLPDLHGLNRGNAFLECDTVQVSCIDPSVTIRYTTDGSMPQASSAVYTAPIEVRNSTQFVFRAFGADGRKGDAVRSTFTRMTPTPAVQPTEALERGLSVVWHDYPGDSCACITDAPILGRYVVDSVAIPREAHDNIGLVFTGYVEVPSDGVYTLELYSDDGSQLSIDHQLVNDNDGMHDAVLMVTQHAMQRGLHPLRLTYFDHNGGALRLRITDKHGKPVETAFWHARE